MRQRMGAVRRRKLAEAALQTMKEEGFARTTVQRVSATAGLAPGLVHHYFATKADMIEAAIRLASTEISTELVRRLAMATTPRRRLDAVIAANLTPAVFNPEVTRAWLAFAAQAEAHPRHVRIVAAIYGRMTSNLRHALRGLVSGSAIEDMALSIALMIDGAWMRCALGGAEVTAEAVAARIGTMIDAELAWPG
jgi:transcriptional repressor BetI